jgi:hypothetical protein
MFELTVPALPPPDAITGDQFAAFMDAQEGNAAENDARPPLDARLLTR